MGKEGTENLEAIEEKIDKGEALSKEEEALIQGAGPAEKNEVDEDPELVDPEKVTVEKTGDGKEKAEDTPSEKDAEADKAKKEKTAENTGAIDPEREKLVKADAEKPLDEIDLSNYSPRERALFFELKEERIKRQASQREADTLKFQRAKEEAKKQFEAEREAADAKAKAEKTEDPFEGLEDDDLLTAGQMKKIIAGTKKTSAKEEKTISPELKRAQDLQMENWVLKAQSKLPGVDLQTVTALADEVLMRNGVRDEIASAAIDEVVAKGGNPLIATYNFLKAHPKYSSILEEKLKGKGGSSESDKAKDEEARTNKERAERIEANKKKPVTTGAGGGAAASGEYTIQEILDMPEDDFARLPKKQRDKILEAF